MCIHEEIEHQQSSLGIAILARGPRGRRPIGGETYVVPKSVTAPVRIRSQSVESLVTVLRTKAQKVLRLQVGRPITRQAGGWITSGVLQERLHIGARGTSVRGQ